MCVSASTIMLGSTLMQGASSLLYGRAQMNMARADARAERDAAQSEAEQIMRAARSRAGAARAATAASGTRVDDWALGVEQEILTAGETDAANTILTGDRRARSILTGGRLQQASGMMGLAESLFSGAYQMSGWKGAVGDDAGGMRFSRTGADIRARR
jgi:outer membrane murein-binding lipoprotein Lpp